MAAQISATNVPLAPPSSDVNEGPAHRGYGFVTFTTDAVAQRIIKTHHGHPLGRAKKTHSIKWAETNLLSPRSRALIPPSTETPPPLGPGMLPRHRGPPPPGGGVPLRGHGTSMLGSHEPPRARGDSAAPPLAYNTGLLTSGFDVRRWAEEVEPPYALLARAKELHVQTKPTI